jgi:hypothetical protein
MKNKTDILISNYSRFIVTGVDRDGKRFRLAYGQNGARTAWSINLWKGTVWGVRVTDGKREKLKTVLN